jgi:hypothetical protein
MKIGDIVFLGENMPWHVRKPHIDWRGHVETADYNGYAKITEINGDVITVYGLMSHLPPKPYPCISMPVDYRIVENEWVCLQDVKTPPDWDYDSTLKVMTDPEIYAKRYKKD